MTLAYCWAFFFYLKNIFEKILFLKFFVLNFLFYFFRLFWCINVKNKIILVYFLSKNNLKNNC
jgi:hypothetical protein